MRKTKSFRMSEYTIKCIKELCEKYTCDETSIIEALIIERYQKETQLGSCLDFEEILDIIK